MADNPLQMLLGLGGPAQDEALAGLGQRRQRPLFGGTVPFNGLPQQQLPPNDPFGGPIDLATFMAPRGPAAPAASAAPAPFVGPPDITPSTVLPGDMTREQGLTGGVRFGGQGPPATAGGGGDGAAALIGARPAPNYSVVTNHGVSTTGGNGLFPGQAAPSQEITGGSSLSIGNGIDTQQFNPEGRQVGGGMVGTPSQPFNQTSQAPQGYGSQLALLDAIRSRAMQDTPVVIGGGSMEDFNQQMARRGQVMSGLLQNALPNILNNNLGQGELGLRGTELLGTAGLPGRLGIAQQDANTRAQENERYGPSARYDTFYTQAYGAFPPGTPHDARVRGLQQQGMPPPQFLAGGRPGGQQPILPGGSQPPLPTGARNMYGDISNPYGMGGGGGVPPVQGGQNAVDNAFELGTSAFPRDPVTGRRSLPAPGSQAAMDAITRIIGGMDDATLRSNFPAIQQRLLQEVGGADTLDAWINSSDIMDRFRGAPSPQSTQVNRLLGMARMQRSSTVPGAPQNSMLENTGAHIRNALPNIVGNYR